MVLSKKEQIIRMSLSAKVQCYCHANAIFYTGIRILRE
jgi:hypothetical protein